MGRRLAAYGGAAEAEASAAKDIAQSLGAFVGKLDRVFGLAPALGRALRSDFREGIGALLSLGVPAAEILRRLQPPGLDVCGNEAFYPLDNGAKQYPLVMRRGQMAMFRVCAVLSEPVEPALLQLALTFTLRRFPHYATRLRRGAFWYYLSPYPGRYAVCPEGGAPLRPIDVSDENEPLFRVLYAENRVTAELFHILADGMGGVLFLKSLLTDYYRLLGEDAPEGDDRAAHDEPPLAGDGTGFGRFRSRMRGDSLLAPRSVQIAAPHWPDGRCEVEQYRFSAEKLVEAAHRYGVSATALMSAVILSACRETAKARKGAYRLQVPVDLRRVFSSRSLRNFSWFVTLVSRAERPLAGGDLAADLAAQLKAAAAAETLERNISAAQRTIRRLRFVPLPWKTAFLRTAYLITGNFFFTTTLSNLGRIELPEHLGRHVLEISAALGPSHGNPYGFALATVHDCAVLSVTRATGDRTLIRRFTEAAFAYGLAAKTKG